MASCLDEAFWKAIVFDSRWLGEKAVVASSCFLSSAPPPAPQAPSLLLLSPSPAKENPKAIVFDSWWLGEKGVVAIAGKVDAASDRGLGWAPFDGGEDLSGAELVG